MKSKATSAYAQRGMSSLSWLVVLAVAGFFMMCAFKIVPPYAENMYVVDALKSLGNGATPVAEMTKGEIRSQLQKNYMLNNVRAEGPQNIEFESTRNGMLINVNYEVRVNIYANADVVISFANQLDTSKPGECCKPVKSAAAKK